MFLQQPQGSQIWWAQLLEKRIQEENLLESQKVLKLQMFNRSVWGISHYSA